MSRPATGNGASRPWLFLALQVALLAAAAGWMAARAERARAARALPEPRPAPLALAPLDDDPSVVGDEELARVVPRVVLRRGGGRPRIGEIDHMLRLWGPAATFDDRRTLSGADLLAPLIDHRRFLFTYGTETPPLLIDDGATVRVRAFEGEASSTHIDHTLASLAEVGLGLDTPVSTPSRRATLAALVRGSLADFSLNQHEVEWSALVYALYLPPGRSWRTAEGQEITFDRLAARLMREELTEGVCSAHHRFHALVALLRADELAAERGEPRMLSPATRGEVLAFLRDVTALLVAHQHPLGFWNDDWSFAAPESVAPGEREGDRLGDRIIVTGHALEWWALAPEEAQPPRAVVRAAARWLVATVDGLSDEEIATRQVTFLTHAARALLLWRGLTHPPAWLTATGPDGSVADIH